VVYADKRCADDLKMIQQYVKQSDPASKAPTVFDDRGIRSGAVPIGRVDVIDGAIATPVYISAVKRQAETNSPARSGADLAELVNGSGFANGRAPSLYGKRGGEECRHMPAQLR
jgi:hypothetical protein